MGEKDGESDLFYLIIGCIVVFFILGPCVPDDYEKQEESRIRADRAYIEALKKQRVKNDAAQKTALKKQQAAKSSTPKKQAPIVKPLLEHNVFSMEDSISSDELTVKAFVDRKPTQGECEYLAFKIARILSRDRVWVLLYISGADPTAEHFYKIGVENSKLVNKFSEKKDSAPTLSEHRD